MSEVIRITPEAAIPGAEVEGLFTVLICIPGLAALQAQPDPRHSLHDPGPIRS